MTRIFAAGNGTLTHGNFTIEAGGLEGVNIMFLIRLQRSCD